MITNCINCGAPLKNKVCEYCGTRYESSSLGERIIKLEVGGEIKSFYIGTLEKHTIDFGSYRDEKGILHRHCGEPKLKISLIEY